MNKIRAIKIVREETGADLWTAKTLVERLFPEPIDLGSLKIAERVLKRLIDVVQGKPWTVESSDREGVLTAALQVVTSAIKERV